jgi:hypothetical protein
MNELECKVCNEPTSASEDAVAITCAGCVNDMISVLNDVGVS